LVLVVGTRKIVPRSQDARKPGSGEVKGGAVLTVLWRLNLKPFDNPVQEFAVDDAQYDHRSVSYPIQDPEVTGSQTIDRRPEIL
jgi:hypothetical protein